MLTEYSDNYDAKDNGAIALPATLSWQGHRGARGLSPENSIPSFLKALEYPVTTLELDVAVSKDQQLIVTHEPWFNHEICTLPNGQPMDKATGKALNIYQMTYGEIKQYDCGGIGNKKFPEQVAESTFKPSMKEMVETVDSFCRATGRALPDYNIEIKSERAYYGIYSPQPAEFVTLVLKEVAELGIAKRCNLQSFDIEILEEINKQDATILQAYLVENEESIASNLVKLDFTPPIYSPYYKLLSKEKIQLLHDKGIKVIPWTVNNGDAVRELIAMGVDGIITDYPNMAKR